MGLESHATGSRFTHNSTCHIIVTCIIEVDIHAHVQYSTYMYIHVHMQILLLHCTCLFKRGEIVFILRNVQVWKYSHVRMYRNACIYMYMYREL